MRSLFFALALLCCLAVTTANADSLGSCYSAKDLQTVRYSLRSGLQTGEIGILTWCVLSQDRGRIVYHAASMSAPKPGDNQRLQELKSDFGAFCRRSLEGYAQIEGGCLKAPVQERIRP